ncbi:MAG: LysR substrate-binding domain-containing protein [Ilumatobacteraceae bacterium]
MARGLATSSRRRWRRSASARKAVEVEVSSSAGARLAALSGVGVAFVPRCRVVAEVRSGDLRVVRLADVRIDQPIRVIWRGARPADAAARQLLEHLRVRAAAATAAAAAGS